MMKNQTKTDQGADKRKQQRAESFIPVEFHSRGAMKGSGRIVNLSIGGLTMVSTTELSIGKVLTLEFALPDGTECKFEGQIVYAVANEVPRSYGISFVSEDLKGRMKLAEFVAALRVQAEAQS